MAAALKQPATRRAAVAAAAADGDVYGDLWTYWVAPRYRERGVAVVGPSRAAAVEGRVGALKPALEEATDGGEEGPEEEIPEWVVRLTTRRDLRVGRARRAAKATGPACCYYRTSDTNAASGARGHRHRQDMDRGKPGRKAAPALGRAKKGYISRNSFEVLMREIEAGELDACEELFHEGAEPEPERDTKLEPQRQTLQAYIEMADRRATTLRQKWPAVVKFKEMDAGAEMFQDGETFAEPERDSKLEPQRHAVEPCIVLADTEDRCTRKPALVVMDQEITPDGAKRDELLDEGDNKDKHLERRLKFCFAKDDRPVVLKTNILKRVQVQRTDNATAAGEDAPRNPLLGADRRAYRRTTGGPGRDGGGWGSGGGEERDGGGGTYRYVGPDKTPVPRARCQGARCKNPAKRYCSGCHSIYCPGCGCDCDPAVLHYVLQEPILVGDCEIHHRLSDPFPDYPYVLVSGVRSLLHGRVDYTFASVHDIFRVEGIEPDIPVLVCRLKDMGPFSWTAHPLTLVPGTVARTDLFR